MLCQENTYCQEKSAVFLDVATAPIKQLPPMKNPLVVFDLETTIYPEQEIIQIAGIKVSTEWGVLSRFCFYTDVPVERNLGLSPLSITNPKPIKDQIKEFLSLCRDSTVASWSAFDYNVLHNACDKYLLPFEIVSKKYLDLLSVVTAVSSFMGKRIDRSLANIAKNYSVTRDESRLHQADYDAQLAFETYKECLTRLNQLTT